MPHSKRTYLFAITTALAIAGAGVLASHPASAAISNCTFGGNASRGFAFATCTESAQLDWFLQLTCDRGAKTVIVKGSLGFGPGTATSSAQCGVGSEILDSRIVEMAPGEVAEPPTE